MSRLTFTKAAGILALALGGAAAARAQAVATPRAVEVPAAVVSARVASFPQPLRAGAGARGDVLEKALLVTVAVAAQDYDALPPDIEPFLYVGARELRTFQIDRGRDAKTLYVTFFSPQADDAGLADDAPVVLTIDHGAPVRNARRFAERTDLPRFRKAWLKDGAAREEEPQ